MKYTLAGNPVDSQKRLLWVDGVGGFLLLDRDEVIIGQAVSESAVDIGIVGDLSRQAGAIRRSEGDYLLQPLQATKLNGKSADRAQLLRAGDEIQFGERVRMRFSLPSPLSATARLDLLSLSRFRPSVDAVLLMADSCILGPDAGSHIKCLEWTSELLLVRHSSGWFFQSSKKMDVNGKTLEGRVPWVAGMRIRGEDFSLSIE